MSRRPPGRPPTCYCMHMSICSASTLRHTVFLPELNGQKLKSYVEKVKYFYSQLATYTYFK